MNMPLLNAEYFGNTLMAYLVAAGMVIAGLLVVFLFSRLVASRLTRWAASTETLVDDFFVAILERTLLPLMYFGVVYLGLNGLQLNDGVKKLMEVVGALLVTFLGVNFLRRAIQFLVFGYWLKRQGGDVERQLRGLMPIFSVTLWALGIIFLLDNLGFQVSAMVAGLGIGGVAVALAAQAVLGDFFSYFAITVDRPFELGDFIILGDYMGTVEHIGIKTTRIRSLGGEQLVLSNTDLTNSRLRNYKRMQTRRVVFKLGVTYDTSLDKLTAIPPMVRAIVERTPNTRFDRCHFASYGDFNLVIEVVYFVLSSDYNVYMDVQQAINFAIKEEFEKLKIEFAFPTQTVYLHPTAESLKS